MSIYPPYWNAKVTVYHRTTSSAGVVTWTPTTYHGCFWQTKVAQVGSDGAYRAFDRIVCRFRLPAPTISTNDIVVKGELSTVIDEYADGQRSTDFLKLHKRNAFVASSVHENDDDVRGIPHVYTEGVNAVEA